MGAQSIVQGDKPYHSRIGIAGSVRDRLQRPAGEVMGFYAGLVTLKYKYNQKKVSGKMVESFIKKLNHFLQTKICSKIF